MDRPLPPVPSWILRIVLCVVLSLPALLNSAPWPLKVFAVFFTTVITGSGRDSRVRGAVFESRLFVAFVPMKPERVKLTYVVEIQTGLRKDAGMTDWLLFGGLQWFMDRIMQWTWPWMAGEFELWLVTARDKRILAWRGNRESNFQANLATLSSTTGATVRRF